MSKNTDESEQRPAFAVGVLTISDAGAKRERPDTSGDIISQTMKAEGFREARREIVPDEKGLISAVLARWCDEGRRLC